MNPWINYHHLLYFKTIAEEGSISKAAKKLLLGQPTLSAQLKIFEEQIGVRLFERHHKRLRLTEQGRVALDYAKSIFKLGNEMFEVLNDKMDSPRLRVQIGALDSIPKEILLEMSKLALKLFNCQMSFVEGKTEEMIRELSEYRLDLFVTNTLPSAKESKYLIHRLVSKKPVSIYGAPRFKSLKKDFPHSMNDQPFVLPTFDSKMRSDLEHWLRNRFITIDTVAETQDISLKKLVCAEGLGLMPAASYTVAQQVKRRELVEIGRLTGVYEELFLVSIPRKIANPLAAALMKQFQI